MTRVPLAKETNRRRFERVRGWLIPLEAIKDIPREDVTSRVIRYQDALLAAREADSAPVIPLGRRGMYKLAMRNLRRNRRNSYR